MLYPVFNSQIVTRGIKQTTIAKALGISTRALFNKRSGKTALTWDEACIIQKRFFPDISKDDLFNPDN